MNRITTALSGALSSILVVTGILLLVGGELDTLTDEEIREHFADGANRGADLAGMLLVVLGAVLFLWFLAHLKALLATDRAPAENSSLLFGAGSTATSLLVAAAALLGATALAAEYGDHFQVDPDQARLAISAGYGLLTGSVFVNCLTVAVASVLIRRDDALPGWLAWVGFVAIPLALVEAFLLPVFVIPLWVLITALTLAARPDAPRPPSEPATA